MRNDILLKSRNHKREGRTDVGKPEERLRDSVKTPLKKRAVSLNDWESLKFVTCTG